MVWNQLERQPHGEEGEGIRLAVLGGDCERLGYQCSRPSQGQPGWGEGVATPCPTSQPCAPVLLGPLPRSPWSGFVSVVPGWGWGGTQEDRVSGFIPGCHVGLGGLCGTCSFCNRWRMGASLVTLPVYPLGSTLELAPPSPSNRRWSRAIHSPRATTMGAGSLCAHAHHPPFRVKGLTSNRCRGHGLSPPLGVVKTFSLGETQGTGGAKEGCQCWTSCGGSSAIARRGATPALSIS